MDYTKQQQQKSNSLKQTLPPWSYCTLFKNKTKQQQPHFLCFCEEKQKNYPSPVSYQIILWCVPEPTINWQLRQQEVFA